MQQLDSPALSTKQSLWAGICGRCPQCGKGALFQSYLKQNQQCPICSEDFSYIRADDGPAWLTILLTLHIVVPIAVMLSENEIFGSGIIIGLMLTLTIACALFLLPRTKGFFIAAIWLYMRKKAVSKT